VSHQLGDQTADEVQREWKLTIGVPILRSENESFREFYDQALRPRTYEQKLAAMTFVPITSIMTVPQMSAFMDAVLRRCSENGILLTIPENTA
jgi:glutamate-1-semialdehyde aminotransferase